MPRWECRLRPVCECGGRSEYSEVRRPFPSFFQSDIEKTADTLDYTWNTPDFSFLELVKQTF